MKLVDDATKLHTFFSVQAAAGLAALWAGIQYLHDGHLLPQKLEDLYPYLMAVAVVVARAVKQ